MGWVINVFIEVGRIEDVLPMSQFVEQEKLNFVLCMLPKVQNTKHRLLTCQVGKQLNLVNRDDIMQEGSLYVDPKNGMTFSSCLFMFDTYHDL